MIESLYILILTSMACGILGVFLVSRNLSMVTDAISHSIFLGIVLAYFIVHDLGSPYLIVGATVFGILTVVLIELLIKSRLVKSDAATGIVFPFLFSIGVLLITKFASNVCLHVDTVLMGDVMLATLKRTEFFGMDMPVSMANILVMLVINLAFVLMFFKELKALSFDQDFTSLSGFSPVKLHYGLMTLVSLTCVVSFEAVGAILVIGLFVIPAAQAYLFTKKLEHTLIFTVVFGVINSTIGYKAALSLNVSMAGMVATVSGLSFLIIMLVSPEGGVTKWLNRIKQKKDFDMNLVLFHVDNHTAADNERCELGLDFISHHVNWTKGKTLRQCKVLISKGLLDIDSEKQVYRLTDAGKTLSRQLKESYGIH